MDLNTTNWKNAAQKLNKLYYRPLELSTAKLFWYLRHKTWLRNFPTKEYDSKNIFTKEFPEMDLI